MRRLVPIPRTSPGLLLSARPHFDGQEWGTTARVWRALLSIADDLIPAADALDTAMAALLRSVALDRWRALGRTGWCRLLVLTEHLGDAPARADAVALMLAWVAQCLGWGDCVRDAQHYLTHAPSEYNAMMPPNNALEVPNSATEQVELAERCVAPGAKWWMAWRALDVLRVWAGGPSAARFALLTRALDVLDAVDGMFAAHGISDGPLAVLDTLHDIQRALIQHDPSSPLRVDLACAYAQSVLKAPSVKRDPSLIRRAYKELNELSRYTPNHDVRPVALAIDLLEAWLQLSDPQAEAALGGLLMVLPARRMDKLTLRAVRLCLYVHTPSEDHLNRNLNIATGLLQSFLDRATLAHADRASMHFAEAIALRGLITLTQAEAGAKDVLEDAAHDLYMADMFLTSSSADASNDAERQRDTWLCDVRLGRARCVLLEAHHGWDLTPAVVQDALGYARYASDAAHRASDTDLELQARWIESRLTALPLKDAVTPSCLKDALKRINDAVDDLDRTYGALMRMGLHTAGKPMREVFARHRAETMYAQAHFKP